MPRKTYLLPQKITLFSDFFVGEQVEMATTPQFSPICEAMFSAK